MSGLTSTGFEIERLPDIREELASELASLFGPTIGASARSDHTVLGVLVGIIAERYASLWELAQAVHASIDPDAATGAQLQSLAAITGTLPLPPLASRAALTLTGDDSTEVVTGSRVSGPSGEWLTQATVTLEELAAWTISTNYFVGNRVRSDGKCYQATASGLSDSSGPGPTHESGIESDGTVEWLFLGEGEAVVDVDALHEETGPVLAAAYTITEIETPVSGWQGVINVNDAIPGRAEEQDGDLRIRRIIELSRIGSATIDAIRAALLDIPEVTLAIVYQNTSMVTDADGMPPKSVEALVEGGDDQVIFDTMLLNVAAGIEAHGTEVGTSVDSAGNEWVMKFSRPVEIEIHAEIDLIKDPNVYPANGDDLVALGVATFGNQRSVGANAVASLVKAWCFTVPGVLDVPAVRIGTSPSPAGSTTIVITNRQRAAWDTSRIVVDSTDGNP